jgi:hypothetical protein
MSYNSKCKVPQDYINLAMEQLQDDQTFSAKAHQKEAMTCLNRAYEMVRGQNNLNSTCELCWDQPFDLHQIRDRHFAMFKEEHHVALRELVSLRAIFKFIEVVKPAPKNDAVERKAAEVTNEVKNLFETRMAQYNRAIDLGRLFNYLPVSVTPHHVTNQFGTSFIRCFYYLNGKMTPLNIIMAAAGQLEREKEKQGA